MHLVEDLATKVEEQVGLDSESLLALLGSSVALGGAPLSLAQRVAIGRAWLAAQAEALRGRICKNESIRAIRAAKDSQVALATAIAELAGSYLKISNVGVIATLGVILARQNLDKYCGGAEIEIA